MEKPKHVYVGRKSCGCVMAICTDDNDHDTFKTLADWTKKGRLTVERVTWETYVNEVSKEPTFMKCNHGKNGQLKLAI